MIMKNNAMFMSTNTCKKCGLGPENCLMLSFGSSLRMTVLQCREQVSQ